MARFASTPADKRASLPEFTSAHRRASLAAIRVALTHGNRLETFGVFLFDLPLLFDHIDRSSFLSIIEDWKTQILVQWLRMDSIDWQKFDQSVQQLEQSDQSSSLSDELRSALVEQTTRVVGRFAVLKGQEINRFINSFQFFSFFC